MKARRDGGPQQARQQITEAKDKSTLNAKWLRAPSTLLAYDAATGLRSSAWRREGVGLAGRQEFEARWVSSLLRTTSRTHRGRRDLAARRLKPKSRRSVMSE